MRFDAYVLAASIFNATIGRITPRNNDSTSRSAFRTCRRIQSALGPDVVQLSGAEYSATASSAWSLFNAASQPTCIVFPQSAKDVQVAMGAIFQDKIHYAVQSGGHSAMTGWNTVQDGVLFFFSRMKNASYDAVKDTITLQPGIRWGEALTELESLGVAPMGGRFGDVGTGLLLGGGLSYLSGEHGFSSDAYVELDVVLVTGKLVTATATNEYSDLFWALKGGANRFGIVTRYEVQAIHTGTNAEKNWFGGFIMYPNSSADALLQATEKFVRIVSDPRASLLMVFGYTANGTEVTPIHLLSLFYHGSALPEPIFGDFLSIPATLTQLSPVSYVEANSLLGPGADRGFGHLFGASAFNNSVGVETYFTSFREFSDYTLKIKDTLSSNVLAFTPILDSQILAGQSRGGNPMDPPRGNYVAIQIHTSFANGLISLPPSVADARRTLFERMPKSPNRPFYINECDVSQNVFATYGRYKELKRTYAKYDPTRFNIRFTDGPIGL